MDSHENGWEDLTGLALESTQHSPTTGPVDIHTGPTPDEASNGTEILITESTSWDWGFNQLKRALRAAKGAATFQVVDFIKKQ
jgi:hypothetical protein